jgi:ATP-binding cassette subfamily B (MDR/TAP) protein 1
VIGLVFSFIFGAAMPSFNIGFGGMIDDMGTMETQEGNPMESNCILMCYVAAGVLVASGIYIASMASFSAGVAHKLKIEYFTKALSKDAAFYDEQNPNEMVSKINKEAGAVQKGTSEKIGNLNQYMSCFCLGFVVAFWFGWKLSLILLAGLPFVAFAGVAWGMSLQTGMVE